MNYQKLELHFAQIDRTISICRHSFPNHPQKQAIYDNLIRLFNGIKSSSYKTFNIQDLDNTKFSLDVIFNGIQFLDYKEEEEIPKRLIYCLNQALNDWIPNGTNIYYIVISHNNNLTEFLFNYLDEGIVDAFNHWVTSMFSVSYKPALIQISKPKFLFDDFIGSTPVYHELGHFIDNNYQIIKNLFKNAAFSAKNKVYYEEHFADIFAAQYIGRSCIEPLNYNAPGTRKINVDTHPSNEMRISVVDAFLNGSGDAAAMEIVNHLKQAVIDRGCGELKIRNVNLTEDPFESQNAILLDNAAKVHSLFLKGWEHWLNPSSSIRIAYPDPVECCNKINAIIKESIEITMTSAAPITATSAI